MADYRGTVHVPVTSFPMRGDLLHRQEEMLARWQAQDLYRAILEDRRDAQPFIIHDGPPYASGQVHVGIGLNKILKDVVAKFHAMRDFRVPFVPGWDCHGLPIELEVLKALGDRAREMSPAEIRRLCEEKALRYVAEQKRQFQLLGVFADWERPYLTMHPTYESSVLGVLLDLVRRGYVYRAVRPISWCVECRTALAEAEEETRVLEGNSIWLWYECGDALARLVGEAEGVPNDLLVWTTSAWSLPGSVAVAVHPELDYGIYDVTDAGGVRRIVAILEAAADGAFETLGFAHPRRLQVVQGSALAGIEVRHPLFDRQVPVVSADFVRPGQGSGFVHIAPAHGPEDFQVATRNRLPVPNPIDGEGRYTDEAGPFAGEAVRDAERHIVDTMRERGSLAALHRAEHAVPTCWRCGNTVVTRATDQWFVRIDHRESDGAKTLREQALIEVEVVKWISPGSRERMRDMIESRPDWCISRQRIWGVPLPSIECRGCREPLLDARVIERVRDAVGEHGSAVWFEREAAAFVPADVACPKCGGAAFEKGRDVLDVWFESGTSWQAVLVADHRQTFPADLVLEGTDQHRGWFQLSLLPALVSKGKSPYRAALTHGFVLNERRERMNRSRGDLITLADALRHEPADLIRLYFLSTDIYSDIPLSLEMLKSAEPVYRTIRNTFRYLLGSLDDFVPREHAVHLDDLDAVDLWMLGRFHELVRDVTDAYGHYDFQGGIRAAHRFCDQDLSAGYFDVLKDRLYCGALDSAQRRSSQTVLHSIVTGLVKLLAPILPYTCDEVWALVPGHSDCASVHLSKWPQPDEGIINSRRARDVAAAAERVSTLAAEIRVQLERLRAKKEIGQDAQALVRLHVSAEPPFFAPLTPAQLRELLGTDVELTGSAEDLRAASSTPGVSFDVLRSPHRTCERCRRAEATTGERADELCTRCATVLDTPPEIPQLVTVAPPVTPEMRPADVARFLRERDIRKVAILREDEKFHAWALHAPSQEVRPLEALQPLADYVGASPDYRDHAAILLGLGEHTDVLFGIGIHHLKYGTPLGGTREWRYPAVAEMLDNLLRLSWGMSVKNAVAELPHGGGKSIIDTCGLDLKIHRELRREIYKDFGQFNASLFGRYICAEDMGNTTADTRDMLSTCRHVMCLSQGVGGSGNPSRFTALAAWAAAKAGWKFATGTTSFSGLTIALQGAGNVGRNMVALLIEGDPDIKRIYLADRDPEQIKVIQNILLKKGKEDLLEILSSKDPLEPGGSYVERDDERGKDYILYTPCDILIPAAVGKALNPVNAERVQCKLIVPIANNVYTDNDAVSDVLYRRGIVDVVENNVNWGGALAAASELYGYDEDNVAAACANAFSKTHEVLSAARAERRTPWSVTRDLVRERIFHATHPIADHARSYLFIGNISKELASWVLRKWLRNVVDRDADAFPALAASYLERAILGRVES
ncbi:MAG: isoleucine--tRNA ligase [Thermoanaerobaculia bacterium]